MNSRQFLSLLTLAGLSGCATPEPPPQRLIAFPVPPAVPDSQGRGKWQEVPREGGAEYVQVINHMEDLVSFYGFWADVAPTVRSFDDLEVMLRADTSFGFQYLQRGEVYGVPVLWFEKAMREHGSGSPKLAELLKAHQRQPTEDYFIRTRGALLFQPGSKPRFVTVACARTSQRGEIGSFYLNRFQSWLTSIVTGSFL